MGGGGWRTHKIETQTQHGKPQTYQGRLLGTYIHHTIPGGKAGVYSHTTRVMKNREGGRREHMERGKACVTMLGRSPGTFPPPHTHTHKNLCQSAEQQAPAGGRGEGFTQYSGQGAGHRCPTSKHIPGSSSNTGPSGLGSRPTGTTLGSPVLLRVSGLAAFQLEVNDTTGTLGRRCWLYVKGRKLEAKQGNDLLEVRANELVIARPCSRTV